MDEVYDEGDLVWFQEKNEKDWKKGKVLKYRSNEIEVECDEIVRRVHPNRVSRYFQEIEGVEDNSDKSVDEDKLLGRMRTRSMTKVRFVEGEVKKKESSGDEFIKKEMEERRKEKYDIYMSRVDEMEEDDIDVLVVELSVTQHNRPDVIHTKRK